ncbi:MAG: Rieske (2Fe-2S) protein [Bryobacteraceae bacterium]|nr:Rieske (2Fe-2S) protein [Bryobacteraceae bacterium]
MERRQFLLVAGAPLLCCDVDEIPLSSVTVEGSRVAVDLDKVRWLTKTGAAGKIIDAARKLNLVLAHPVKGQYVALQRKCTHGGGPVAYNHKRQTVMCTCWGHSEFDMKGTVLGGPAKRPLLVYATKVVGKQLEIEGVVS